MKKRTTSYDVAQMAGVSQSAVSRCFTRGASIAPATRQKIIQAVNELGYVPNRLAQGLSTQKSSLVALLLPSATNLHFPELLTNLTIALEKNGLRPLVFIGTQTSHAKGLIDEALSHAVDGLISAIPLDQYSAASAKAQKLPIVMLNRDGTDAGVSSVISDHSAGAFAIADRLIDVGCKRIGMIEGPADSPTGQWRSSAFQQKLHDLGYDNLSTTQGDYTYQSGQSAARQILEIDPTIDGLFCANDLMAMGALDVARLELHRSIPSDLKIIGFDDIMASAWPSYQLTTVRQQADLLSDAVAKSIAALIDNPDLQPSHIRIPCQFIARKTCG